jgi:hypothetical protein
MNRYTEAEDRIVLGIDAAQRRFELPVDNRKVGPTFILSAGWRSGSTLLQRMLTSENRLMWGEPFAQSAILRNAAAAWAPFSDEWPDRRHVASNVDVTKDLASRWIANFYPDPADLLQAQRAYLDALFGVPAANLGYPAWGLKGVRLGGGVAHFLQLVYSEARFVFLVRNPYDAYRSYLTKITTGGNHLGWHYSWPDDRVASPEHFGRLWTGLADSMQRHGPRVRGQIIRYEDLIKPETTTLLEQIGLSVVQSQLEQKIGSSYSGGHRERTLSAHEVQAVRSATGAVAEDFAYFGPSRL